MSCCGSRRAAASAAAAADVWVEFHYVGQNAITVFGPVTRHQYRFAGPGARVAVDPRDARAIDGVKNLRRVPVPSSARSG
jgi:hypothetical protein